MRSAVPGISSGIPARTCTHSATASGRGEAILYRNDTEADCSRQELIAWDAVLVEEDRDILESTDPDATVDMSRKVESHMPFDRPGMNMRRCLLAMLCEHCEEVSEAVPAVSVPTAPTLIRAEA
jgi:hypothetical protein